MGAILYTGPSGLFNCTGSLGANFGSGKNYQLRGNLGIALMPMIRGRVSGLEAFYYLFILLLFTFSLVSIYMVFHINPPLLLYVINIIIYLFL